MQLAAAGHLHLLERGAALLLLHGQTSGLCPKAVVGVVVVAADAAAAGSCFVEVGLALAT